MNVTTTGRSYCSIFATVQTPPPPRPPTSCHSNVATLPNKNWWLRQLGFAPTKLFKRLFKESPRVKIRGRPIAKWYKTSLQFTGNNVFAKIYIYIYIWSLWWWKQKEYLEIWPALHTRKQITLFNVIGYYVTWQTTIGSTNMCLEYNRSIYRRIDVCFKTVMKSSVGVLFLTFTITSVSALSKPFYAFTLVASLYVFTGGIFYA